MKACRPWAVALALCLLTSACATITAPLYSYRPRPVLAHPSDASFDFQGSWEGVLDGFDAPHYVDSAGFPMRFRFVVSRWHVRVYTLVSGAWREMKPGQFRMRNSGPHALIYSTTSGRDEDGVWVESSSFTLARTSNDEMIVYWQRTVNNLDVPPTDQWHQFAWGYSGTMRRAAAGD
ncbi:hypothetical protein [Xanthomonas sacchari]|uniref:hypothetical protein n=1 Tax=Xanthomonas sacchari TaxID=56458 RepID=UPI00225E6418|nr:hypothetical protein [Xanthomonas sacchari]MCW0424761.1 hypothetical protein [Xanthomonas sacchari]